MEPQDSPTIPNNEELEYITNNYASWHINFYLQMGFSVDRSIRRGMEEYIEELMEELIHLKGGIQEPKNQEIQSKPGR